MPHSRAHIRLNTTAEASYLTIFIKKNFIHLQVCIENE